jgi:hypothetical protein|tara:strand:- start:4389 stop:4574 length:186 start_codon:yes stop_codon:yes gene_type:complete
VESSRIEHRVHDRSNAVVDAHIARFHRAIDRPLGLRRSTARRSGGRARYAASVRTRARDGR